MKPFADLRDPSGFITHGKKKKQAGKAPEKAAWEGGSGDEGEKPNVDNGGKEGDGGGAEGGGAGAGAGGGDENGDGGGGGDNGDEAWDHGGSKKKKKGKKKNEEEEKKKKEEEEEAKRQKEEEEKSKEDEDKAEAGAENVLSWADEDVDASGGWPGFTTKKSKKGKAAKVDIRFDGCLSDG